MTAKPEFPFLPETGPSPTSTLKRVYLIRHGETDANATGIMQGSGVNLPLSDKGRQQASALGTRFEHTPVDVIVVSTLQRTTETAMYIKKFHPNARVVELKELVEISWGELEAKPPTETITNLWRDWENGNFDAAAPGGESPIEVERRAVPALYDVIRNALPNEKHIAVVIHGRLIRIILASILRNDLSYMNSFHHANTCVNVLDVAIWMELMPKTRN
ncbi:phosphoglycerate mutase [Obelidium mucronatum]|nr:phosphoglycerate mutase [Obelidium mucronatum]